MEKMGFRLRVALIVIGLAALVLLMRDLNNRMAELRRLEFEEKKVSLQYGNMVGTRDALILQVTEAARQSDLRAQGGKSNEGQSGDVLIIPVPVEGTAPKPTEEIVESTVPTENWEFWLAMFFDFEPKSIPILKVELTPAVP